MLKLLPLLLSLVLISSVAQANSCRALFTKQSVTDHFINLILEDKLLGQYDLSLEHKNLLVKDGGLCGPTCAVNSIQAFYSYLGLPTKNFSAPKLLEEIVSLTAQELKKDMRIGASLEEVALTMDALIEGKGTLKLNYDIQEGYRSHFNWVPPVNGLGILAVRVSETSSHAIILLDINPKDLTLRYFDPEYPTVIFKAPYEPHPNSKGEHTLLIDLYGEYADPMAGEVIESLTLNLK